LTETFFFLQQQHSDTQERTNMV